MHGSALLTPPREGDAGPDAKPRENVLPRRLFRPSIYRHDRRVRHQNLVLGAGPGMSVAGFAPQSPEAVLLFRLGDHSDS